MADEKPTEKVVQVIDGPDHGYIGTVRDDTPNEDYSVTGVTKASRGEAEKPAAKPVARKPAAPKSS